MTPNASLAPSTLRPRIAALAFALRSRVSSPHCGPTKAALDIARNAAQAIEGGEDPAVAIGASLLQRVEHFELRVRDWPEAAIAGAQAWRKAVG